MQADNVTSESNQDLPAPQPTQRGIAIPISRPIATYVLLAAIIGIFVLTMVIDQLSETGSNWLVEFGVLWPDGVLHGEFYRIVTGMFLHAGIAHIAFNGYALWIYGKLVEGFFGHTRFLLVYFFAGLFGNIAELLILQTALGASGAIFGIFGAHMVFLYQNRQAFGKRAAQDLRSLGILALINLGFGIFSQITPGAVKIGLAAHVGGFFAGAALAWFICPRYAVVADPAAPEGARVVDTVPQRQILIVSAVGTGVLLASFILSLVVMQRTI
jgi:membrane associated rhomboid family serine protease